MATDEEDVKTLQKTTREPLLDFETGKPMTESRAKRCANKISGGRERQGYAAWTDWVAEIITRHYAELEAEIERRQAIFDASDIAGAYEKALVSKHAENARLRGAAQTYIDERDNPAPDFTMRRVRLDELRAALANEEKPSAK